MDTLYERIQCMCKNKGVSASRMCLDLGLSKSTMSDMKYGRTKGISTGSAQKIASYFGVSVGYLLGEENEKAPTESGERSVRDAKAAFFDGYADDLSEAEKDALWEDARTYAKFKAQQIK